MWRIMDINWTLDSFFVCFPISKLGFSAFLMTQSILLVKSVAAIYMSNPSAGTKMPEKRDGF